MTFLDDSVDRKQIWASIKEFASRFIRPFNDEDKITVAELSAAEQSIGRRLPEALTEFYEQFGKARFVWSMQDELLRPNRLKLQGGILHLCYECQGCWVIGIRESELDQADPPVVWSDSNPLRDITNTSQFKELAPSVSVFAINLLAYVAKYSPHQPDEFVFGISDDDDAVLNGIWDAHPRCRLRESWVNGRVAYFQSEDTFVEFAVGYSQVFPIFLSEAARDRFCRIVERLPFQWQSPPPMH